MKYVKPEIINMSSQASMWCNVGSAGENVDNTCTPGGIPLTVGCSSGNKNTSGHCKNGSSVKNNAPGMGLIYCQTGNNGKIGDSDCKNGSYAYGATSCRNGSMACHCTTGTTA